MYRMNICIHIANAIIMKKSIININLPIINEIKTTENIWKTLIDLRYLINLLGMYKVINPRLTDQDRESQLKVIQLAETPWFTVLINWSYLRCNNFSMFYDILFFVLLEAIFLLR